MESGSGGGGSEDRQLWLWFLIFASLAHSVFLHFSLAPPYLALSPPISLSSPLRPPLLPPGRGGSVSWAGPCPWLWPPCAVCVVGAPGVVCGSSGWKLFFPVWNAGLMWGLLRFFQTQCAAKSSGVSVLQEQGLGGDLQEDFRLPSFYETEVSEQMTPPPRETKGSSFWPNSQLSMEVTAQWVRSEELWEGGRGDSGRTEKLLEKGV